MCLGAPLGRAARAAGTTPGPGVRQVTAQPERRADRKDSGGNVVTPADGSNMGRETDEIARGRNRESVQSAWTARLAGPREGSTG